MKIIRASFLIALLSFQGVVARECIATAQNTDAALYRKHCSACHPNASRLKSSGDIVSLMRNPPLSMPAFREDKLTAREAQAIADFIRTIAPGAKKAPQTAVTPAAPPALAKAVPAVEAPAPAKAVPEKPSKGIKPAKEKKSRVRDFVKSWSIKGRQNDEVVTIQKFEITANANSELAVIPSTKLADYSVKVTSFDIVDRKLKLQFTWMWKNSPSYRRIETYELTLSEDGKKLSGSYSLLTSGGQNVAWSVWGE